MANKIIHKHSSVITDGKAKLPTASQLEYGELAINYAEGVETISMKNSANQIVEIKTTNYLENIIIDNELVTAAALTNLNERIEEIDSTFSNTISETNEKIAKNELVTAHALTDLDDRIKSFEETEFATATALAGLGTQVENHTHGTITLNGGVTGSATIGSGTTAINIATVVANNSHSHTSDNISDSINTSSEITSSATGLVQGKAVYEMATTIETNLNNRIDALVTDIEDNEYVTALAVTELESRVAQLEETIAALQESLANVTAQLANT